MLRATDRQRKHFCSTVTGLSALGTLATAAQAFAGVQFKSYQTHSHVAFSVDPDVAYAVTPVLDSSKSGRGDRIIAIKVTLDNVHEDLDDLVGNNDSRTDKIMVVKTPTADGKRVVYEFMLTEKARDAGIEFFDYRSKSPAEIAVDYWMKPQTAVEAKKAPKPVHAKVAARKKPPKPETAVFGGCGQPLDLAADGVADFKVYHRPYDYSGFFHLMPADADYVYPYLKAGAPGPAGVAEKELQHYRLAIKLYKEDKLALALRTIEFFSAQYPKSTLTAELKFLKASTLVRLGDRLLSERYMEQAAEIYRQVILEDPSAARARAGLSFLVQEFMRKGAPVLALEYALMGANQKPSLFKDPMAPMVFRIASAESLYALGEYDRAETAYQAVIDAGGTLASEGAFRIGEVMSVRGYWDRAVMYYQKAIRDYPKAAAKYPTAYFNLAEAYFRLGRYSDAEKAYREFDHLYGSDDSASWAAHLRLAELEQLKIKSPDPKKHEAIADLYEGVINRHPYSAGALMAELRLARCYKGLGPNDRSREFFDSFFTTRDPKRLEDELVDPVQLEQWMDLTQAEFYENNEDPRNALRQADDYRARLGKTALADSFRKVFSRATVDLVLKLSSASKRERPSELLAVVEHYGDLVQKPEPISYMIAIAKESLDIGDPKAGTETLAAVEPRLADASADEKDAYHLLRARQRQFLGEKSDAVIADLNQVRDDGKFLAQKLEELAKASTDKGDLAAAVGYDARLVDPSPGSVGSKLPLERRMAAAVRQLDNIERLRDTQAAATAAKTAYLRFGLETEYPALLARLKELRIDALYDAGEYKSAVEAIDDVLGASPNHPRHTEFEFKRGKGLAKLGRENEALETFTKLAKAAPINDVWGKSAQGELDQLQWENKVSNQIKDKDRRSSQ